MNFHNGTTLDGFELLCCLFFSFFVFLHVNVSSELDTHVAMHNLLFWKKIFMMAYFNQSDLVLFKVENKVITAPYSSDICQNLRWQKRLFFPLPNVTFNDSF